MTLPTYPAARLVVGRRAGPLRAAHRRGARARRRRLDDPPPLAIAAIIDAAFWASLRREEGQAPRISLAFLPPDGARHPLIFASRLPLAAGDAVEGRARRRAARHSPRRVARRRRVLRVGHDARSAGVLPGRRSRRVGPDRGQASLRAVRQVRQRRGARRRSDQDRRRTRRHGRARLPGDGRPR